MKKLMIAAAIVCAAVVSQGSVVKWGSSATKAPTSATDGTCGGAAINKTDGTWLATVMFYDSTGTTLLGTDSTKMTVSGGSAEFTNGGSWGLSSGITTTQKYSFLDAQTDYKAVIKIDGTTDAYTATKTSDAISFTTGSESGTVSVNPATAFKTANWTVTPVPEPTSAMLLILGMAGLALKRKQK